MQTKKFMGNCTSNPFRSVDLMKKIIDDSKKISKVKFLRECLVEPDIKTMIKRFPKDFEFYESGKYMFFRHSMIEFFYEPM